MAWPLRVQMQETTGAQYPCHALQVFTWPSREHEPKQLHMYGKCCSRGTHRKEAVVSYEHAYPGI